MVTNQVAIHDISKTIEYLMLAKKIDFASKLTDYHDFIILFYVRNLGYLVGNTSAQSDSYMLRYQIRNQITNKSV